VQQNGGRRFSFFVFLALAAACKEPDNSRIASWRWAYSPSVTVDDSVLYHSLFANRKPPMPVAAGSVSQTCPAFNLTLVPCGDIARAMVLPDAESQNRHLHG